MENLLASLLLAASSLYTLATRTQVNAAVALAGLQAILAAFVAFLLAANRHHRSRVTTAVNFSEEASTLAMERPLLPLANDSSLIRTASFSSYRPRWEDSRYSVPQITSFLPMSQPPEEASVATEN